LEYKQYITVAESEGVDITEIVVIDLTDPLPPFAAVASLVLLPLDELRDPLCCRICSGIDICKSMINHKVTAK
jgi:hypothetical protein